MKALKLTILFVLLPCLTQAYTGLYVVGDSLSDTGNAGATANYWHNRNSNSPIWPDFVSQDFGIPYSQKNNQAWSSAATYDYIGGRGTLIPGIQTQISRMTIVSPGTGLFVLWIGLNDIQVAFKEKTYFWITANAALARIQQGIQTLYHKGARTIIIPNIIDLSYTPSYVSSYTASDRVWLRQQIISFNNKLKAMVQGITYPGLKIIYIDVFNNWEVIYFHPATRNILNVSLQGKNDRSFAINHDWTIGENYFFWDHIHPTSKLHRLLASWIYCAAK